jgi:hypothetical protein
MKKGVAGPALQELTSTNSGIIAYKNIKSNSLPKHYHNNEWMTDIIFRYRQQA